MKKYFSDYLFLAVLAGTIVALDQWTKWLVRAKLEFSHTWVPWDWLAPYARIINWKNTGAAFGVLQEFGGAFTILAFLVVGLILYFYPQIPRQDWSLRIALGMQMGGAIGNLVDRLARGFVTDWISVGSFPVFNVADSCISVGAAVLVIGMLIQERKLKASQTASEQPPEEVGSSPELADIQNE
ncbi:MAG: signal peptidase II [Anaerolineales bacterium]|nr:signal peptidase II [Anaerolineales bacterium]